MYTHIKKNQKMCCKMDDSSPMSTTTQHKQLSLGLADIKQMLPPKRQNKFMLQTENEL